MTAANTEPARQIKPRRVSFRPSDLARALKVADKAGKQVLSAKIAQDGSIELAFYVQGMQSSRGNPWDA